MKKLFENWRRFTNEAKIATKDGYKDVEPSKGETEHFFAYKAGKGYILTHKPSGKAVTMAGLKYGNRLGDLKKLMKDLEDANIPGIGDENPSEETLRAIIDVMKDGNPYLKESETVDALKDLINAEEEEDERIEAILKFQEEEKKRQEERDKEQKERDKEQKNISREITQDSLK